jgi:drug/metabolite transporter (DMT)-like permease
MPAFTPVIGHASVGQFVFAFATLSLLVSVFLVGCIAVVARKTTLARVSGSVFILFAALVFLSAYDHHFDFTAVVLAVALSLVGFSFIVIRRKPKHESVHSEKAF